MEYSPIHDKLIIGQSEMKSFCMQIRYHMADIRKLLKVPLTPRKREHGLEKIDHLEKNIINACKAIGIDLGEEWGDKIDLSEFE